MDTTVPSPATPGAACIIIKTGHEDCPACFDPALFQLHLIRNGETKQIDLGYAGSRLLARLAQEPGVVVSREELIMYAWSDRVVGQGSLNQQIYTLRQALGDEKSRRIIQTLPRRGYLLNPQCVLNALPEASTGHPVPPAPVAEEARPEAAAPAVTLDAHTPSPETPADATAAPRLAEPAPPPVAPTALTEVRVTAPVPHHRPRIWPWAALLLSSVTMAGWLTLPDQSAPTTFSLQHAEGSLTFLVMAEDEQRQQALLEEAQPLTRHLAALTAEPAQLLLQKSGQGYQLLCLGQDGHARLLNLPSTDVEQPAKVATERWQWCIAGTGIP